MGLPPGGTGADDRSREGCFHGAALPGYSKDRVGRQLPVLGAPGVVLARHYAREPLHARFARGAEAGDFLLRIADNHYHPLLRQFLVENGVPLDDVFPVAPEEVGFVLAGGSLEDEGSLWRLHPLYDGNHPFEGRDRSLRADDDGDHFTQSAGWVGVRTDNQFVENGCVIRTLRWVAFQRFGYDPDHYFADSPHDDFGFVQHRGPEPIIL